ncbi:hypothetical protein INT47_007227 [Mucor saturninus]|uniref:Uncharacterized protein n=1 Tax=Mucor saturninus TaxID=64648 RepID=A0A8H7R6Q1_9FUNG|nr:hypothetical protein INT47_007227 [Mucor saturninus]
MTRGGNWRTKTRALQDNTNVMDELSYDFKRFTPTTIDESIWSIITDLKEDIQMYDRKIASLKLKLKCLEEAYEI